MAEQTHHFRLYADVKTDYAIERYERECRNCARCGKVSYRQALFWPDSTGLQIWPCCRGFTVICFMVLIWLNTLWVQLAHRLNDSTCCCKGLCGWP